MSTTAKESIAVVSACMQRDGKPTFAHTEVSVTPEEAEDGLHYYLVEADLLQAGYEEPFVHFTESESPAFLFHAVCEFLDAGDLPVPIYIHSEGP